MRILKVIEVPGGGALVGEVENLFSRTETDERSKDERVPTGCVPRESVLAP